MTDPLTQLAVTIVGTALFVAYLAYWCFVKDGWFDVMVGIFAK
jgi:hypothetical protein